MTSPNDPRVMAAINVAMKAMYSKLGTVGGDWCWAAIGLPQYAGQAWCGAFQVWGYRQAGVDLMRACWWLYVPYIRNFAIKIGAWSDESSYGANSCMDWHDDGIADHVGASNPDPDSDLFRQIEGNTSMRGSQDNGNGVLEKYREWEDIMGWVDMHIVLAWMIDTGKWDGRVSAVSAVDAGAYVETNPNGYNEEYIAQIQQALVSNGYSVGASGVDGICGWDTYKAVQAYQRDHGLEVDGIPGPATRASLLGTKKSFTDIRPLQAALRAAADNIAGVDTRLRALAVSSASEWGGETFPCGLVFAQRVVGTTPDGIWGAASRAALGATVEAVQRAVGVEVDGVYGPVTNGAVNRLLDGAQKP